MAEDDATYNVPCIFSVYSRPGGFSQEWGYYCVYSNSHTCCIHCTLDVLQGGLTCVRVHCCVVQQLIILKASIRSEANYTTGSCAAHVVANYVLPHQIPAAWEAPSQHFNVHQLATWTWVHPAGGWCQCNACAHGSHRVGGWCQFNVCALGSHRVGAVHD